MLDRILVDQRTEIRDFLDSAAAGPCYSDPRSGAPSEIPDLWRAAAPARADRSDVPIPAFLLLER